MSPTGVFVVLMLALLIDYLSVGRDSIRDRVAFLLAVAGFRDGFDGSPLDRWTVQRLSDFIGALLEKTGDAYIAGTNINIAVGAMVGLLGIYGMACLIPSRASKRLGRWVTLSFPTSAMGRINWKLWVVAFLLGILADLGRGVIGEAVEFFVESMTWIAAPLVILLFGAA